MADTPAKGAHVQNEEQLIAPTGFHQLELGTSEKEVIEIGTNFDQDDMTRMGKAQEFKVYLG